MKKEKKAKKTNKKEVETGKKKWAVWKTIISVISAVVAIVGVTVLGVYLAGGFNEKIVNPESISFSYDSDLFNVENGQLEVTDNFSLTILSPTEGVTKNKVTLSFSGNLPITKDNGYISNTILKVPEVVTIGQPFDVQLLTELLKDEDGQYILDEKGNRIDWIKGGISTLVATSEYNQIGETRVQIAVDVPVYKTETQVFNSNNEMTNQVVTGEAFTLKSKFIPAKSEFMFSDDANENIASENRRVKKSFFEAKNANNAIVPVYDGKYDMHFVAGDEAADNITINGYSFKNSKTQIEYEKTLADYGDVDFYGAMVVYLAQNIDKNILSDISIKIGEASIGNFTVTTQELSTVTNKTTRFFMSKNNYVENSKFFGVNVYSTSGALLEGMLPNVALSFDFQGQDPTQGVNATIKVSGGEYIDIDGKRYYKPNSDVANYNYAYWDILAKEEQEVQVTVVLIVNTEEGPSIFEISGQPLKYNVKMTVVSNEEKPLGWANQADINVMLDYNTDGTIKPQDVNLSYLPEIPEENLYKDTVFFAYFGTGTKEELKATADSVLGSTGYNYERSGIYSTDTDNLLLFAIEGDRITLQNTGSFKLYYATYKGLTQEGLYDIALMCSGYVNVVCEKALYSDSVANGEVDVANFQENNGEVSIDQGSDMSFGIKFVVNVESVPVFEDEYNKGYMSLILRDKQNNDITSNFLIENVNFAVDGETDQGILEYRLKVNEAVAINDDNGIYFGQMSLVYNDGQNKDITWTFDFPQDKNICVYSPKAQSILIAGGGEYEYGPVITGDEEITVSQSLKENGSFQTNLEFKVNGAVKQFPNVDSLLKALLGENKELVVITDQKQRTDTLSGQWSFEIKSGDSNIIDISADGQSFSFKNANMEKIELYLQSNDKNCSTIIGEGGQFLKLTVNSTGITGMRVNKITNTYEEASTSNGEIITDTSIAEIRKYGTKSDGEQFITLGNLIKFYIGDTEYKNVHFTFSTQFILGSTLSDEQILDMFGQDGMLSLYTKGSSNSIDFIKSSATEIRETLISAKIEKIRINKNFASNQTLQFSVIDEAGAVNTALNFNILSRFSVSTESYPENGEIIYASSQVEIINTVIDRNQNETDQLNFKSLYEVGEYYVLTNGGTPVKSDTTTPDKYIAKFVVEVDRCYVVFSDFWDQESIDFTINFKPEGENSFALNHAITFKVNRDLKIESKHGTYYVLTSGNERLETFVSVKRFTDGDIEGNNYPTKLSFEFSDYLVYSDGNIKKGEDDFFFDYNQKTLETTLYVKLEEVEEPLAEIDVTIGLMPGELYQTIANKFTLKGVENSPTATTQIIGDTEYLVLNRTDENSSWVVGNLESAGIVPSQQDYNGNNLTSYMINGVGQDLTIILNKPKALLDGLNDQSIFMALNFTANTGESGGKILATIHIPLIISSIGFEQVVYNGDKVAANKTLETALAKPEELFAQGIYDEITAGQLNSILSEYSFVAKTGEDGEIPAVVKKVGGLYTLGGFRQEIKYYPLDSSLVLSSPDLIKNIYIDKDANNVSFGTITLNHLAAETGDYYLALEYTIISSDDLSQTFYYLLKVKPDVNVEKSLYAYDGSVEHLIIDVNEQGQVDLDKTYGDTTLHSGYKRFNVSKNLNLIENLTTLKIESKSEKVIVEFSYNVGGGNYLSTLEISNNTANLTTFNINSNVQVGENEKIENFDGNFDLNKLAQSVDAEKVLPSSINILIKEGQANIYYGNREKESDNLVFSTLKYVNEVESVTVDSETYYNNDWNRYVDLHFSSDYSTFYYTPKTTLSITVVVKHTYQGGNANDEFSAVAGEQYYTFVINDDTTNYTIRFKEEGKENKETDKYVWALNNSDGSSETSNTKNLQIDLISNSSGSSDTGTVVRNKANVVLTVGEQGDNKDIKEYSYDMATGIFTLTLNEYIDSDRVVEFAVYTELGYLATLSVELKANASFTPKPENSKDLIGGKDYAFGDLFDIFLNEIQNPAFKNIEVEFGGEGESFVNWENNSILISDLLEDKKLTVNFTLTFEENKTDKTDETVDVKQFKFSYSYTLKANISKKTSVTSDDLTIAGEQHNIVIKDLYGTIGGAEKSDKTTITLKGDSSSPAYNGINFVNGMYNVLTNFVSARGTVDISLTVTFEFEKIEENGPKTIKQSYVVNYSFTVYPSVELSTNYPKPNSDYSEDKEFVENGTTFENILRNFFMRNPIFTENPNADNNNNSRIFIKSAEKTDNQIVYNNQVTTPTIEDVSIIVSKLSNASVSYGNGIYPEVNSRIPTDATITFNRGVYNGEVNEKPTFIDNGQDSIVVFTLIYQEVSITYTVNIVNNLLSVRVNNVSNNTSSGEFGNETVGYEMIYVDATSTKGLFDQYRMANVQMSSSMQSVANQYYLVFQKDNTDNTTPDYKVSYPIFFKADDQGKNLNIDLGISMAGYDFVGAYLTSSFSNHPNLKIQNNQLIGNNIEEELKKIGNDKNKLFEQGKLSLINRIQLVYGNNIIVDYSYFKNNIATNNTEKTSFDISQGTHEPDIIASVDPLKEFNKNDGSKETKVTFSANYYFMPTIDIDIEAKITQGRFLTNLEVNREYESVVELFGIKHPTTNRLLNSSEFTSDDISLKMEILEYSYKDSDANEIEMLLNSYITEYNIQGRKFTNIAPGDEKQQYLSFSMKDNIINEETKYTYDYTLLPLGAKNQGDYELIKFTYSNAGFTKVFHVVVKIMPDFSVRYGGSEGNAKDEGTYVSNIDNIYTISKMQLDTEKNIYSNFTLLGEMGYLSIRHKNGDNTNNELSTKFNLKMQLNINIDSVIYNNDTNVSQKLLSKNDNGTGISNLYDHGWKTDQGAIPNWSDDRTEESILGNIDYLLLENQSNTLTFASIPIVIFGNQYYMIEGKDIYNYTFRLYFCLQPPQGYTTPSPTQETIQLTELEYFDIGAQYELLEIQKTSDKEEDNNIHIVSNQRTPTPSPNMKLIELQGIKAWAFSYDYTSIDDADKQFLQTNGDAGYKVLQDDKGPKYILSSSDQEYLEIKNLMLKYITVENINFYDPQDPSVSLTEDLTPNSSDTPDSTNKRNGYHLATARSNLQGVFNGLTENELRGVYNNPETQEPVAKVDEETKQPEFYKPFQVPRFVNTDIFANSNTADVTMVITLKYNDGSTIEYYDCPINVELTREIIITENDMMLIDGGENGEGNGKSIEGAFSIKSAGIKDQNIKPEFVNDTLEVMIDKNSATTFEMTLTRNNSEIATTSVTVSNTGTNFNKTYYISLSQYFGFNVQIDDTITIKEKTGLTYNAKFYYLTENAKTTFAYIPDSSSSDFKTNYFKVGKITHDIVYIDDASMLNSNMYYIAEKYYIINVNIGEKIYTYRKSKLYYVTGQYYKLTRDYTTEIAYELNRPDSNGGNTTTSISGWFAYYKNETSQEVQDYPIYLQRAIVEKGVVKVDPSVKEGGDSSFLRFSIDPSDGATGKASISNGGVITISKDFGDDEYIKINIYMAVSGNDRNPKDNKDATYIKLGSVRLGIERIKMI